MKTSPGTSVSFPLMCNAPAKMLKYPEGAHQKEVGIFGNDERLVRVQPDRPFVRRSSGGTYSISW